MNNGHGSNSISPRVGDALFAFWQSRCSLNAHLALFWNGLRMFLMLLRLMQVASRVFFDLRHGLRLLARRPAFAAAAVVTLAIGAGASSAVFSAVRTVLLAPLPFRDPGRLVTVWDQNLAARIARSPVSDANYADWRRLNRCFSAMAAYDTWAPTLSPGM